MPTIKLTMLLQQAYLGDWYESVRQDENWMRFREKCDNQQFDMFVKWLNLQFSRYLYDKTGQSFEDAKILYCWLRVTNLQNDLEDGLRFLYLVDILYNVTLSKEFGPKKLGCMKLHKIKNHDTCLKYLQNEANLKCVGINAIDLANGNTKMLTGLIFLLKNDFESRVFKDSNFIHDSQLKLNFVRNSLLESDQKDKQLISKSHSNNLNKIEPHVKSYVKDTSVKYNQRIHRLSNVLVLQQKNTNIKSSVKKVPTILRQRRSSETDSVKQKIRVNYMKSCKRALPDTSNKSTLHSNLESFTFGEFFIPAVPFNQLANETNKTKLHYPEQHILKCEVINNMDSSESDENIRILNYSEQNEIKNEYTQEMGNSEHEEESKNSFEEQQGEIVSLYNQSSNETNSHELSKSSSEFSTDSQELESVEILDIVEREPVTLNITENHIKDKGEPANFDKIIDDISTEIKRIKIEQKINVSAENKEAETFKFSDFNLFLSDKQDRLIEFNRDLEKEIKIEKEITNEIVPNDDKKTITEKSVEKIKPVIEENSETKRILSGFDSILYENNNDTRPKNFSLSINKLTYDDLNLKPCIKEVINIDKIVNEIRTTEESIIEPCTNQKTDTTEQDSIELKTEEVTILKPIENENDTKESIAIKEIIRSTTSISETNTAEETIIEPKITEKNNIDIVTSEKIVTKEIIIESDTKQTIVESDNTKHVTTEENIIEPKIDEQTNLDKTTTEPIIAQEIITELNNIDIQENKPKEELKTSKHKKKNNKKKSKISYDDIVSDSIIHKSFPDINNEKKIIETSEDLVELPNAHESLDVVDIQSFTEKFKEIKILKDSSEKIFTQEDYYINDRVYSNNDSLEKIEIEQRELSTARIESQMFLLEQKVTKDSITTDESFKQDESFKVDLKSQANENEIITKLEEKYDDLYSENNIYNSEIIDSLINNFEDKITRSFSSDNIIVKSYIKKNKKKNCINKKKAKRLEDSLSKYSSPEITDNYILQDLVKENKTKLSTIYHELLPDNQSVFNVPMITVESILDKSDDTKNPFVESKQSNHFTELIDYENYLVKNDAINDSLVNDYNFLSNCKDDDTCGWNFSNFSKTGLKDENKSEKSDSALESMCKNSNEILNEGILYCYSGKTQKSDYNSEDIDELKSGLFGIEDNTDAILDSNSIDSDYDSSMVKTENDVHENLMQKSIDCFDEHFENDSIEITQVENQEKKDASIIKLEKNSETVLKLSEKNETTVNSNEELFSKTHIIKKQKVIADSNYSKEKLDSEHEPTEVTLNDSTINDQTNIDILTNVLTLAQVIIKESETTKPIIVREIDTESEPTEPKTTPENFKELKILEKVNLDITKTESTIAQVITIESEPIIKPKSIEETIMEPLIIDQSNIHILTPEAIFSQEIVTEAYLMEPKTTEDTVIDTILDDQTNIDTITPEQKIATITITDSNTKEQNLAEEIILEPIITRQTNLDAIVTEIIIALEIITEPIIVKEIITEPIIAQEIITDLDNINITENKQKEELRLIKHKKKMNKKKSKSSCDEIVSDKILQKIFPDINNEKKIIETIDDFVEFSPKLNESKPNETCESFVVVDIQSSSETILKDFSEKIFTQEESNITDRVYSNNDLIENFETGQREFYTEKIDNKNFFSETKDTQDSILNDENCIQDKIIIFESKSDSDSVSPIQFFPETLTNIENEKEEIKFNILGESKLIRSEFTINKDKTIVIENEPIKSMIKLERRNKKKRKYKPSYLLSESELNRLVNAESTSAKLPVEQENIQNTEDHSNAKLSTESFELCQNESLIMKVESVGIQISSYVLDVDHSDLEEHLSKQEIYVPDEIDTEILREETCFEIDSILITPDEKNVKEESTQVDLPVKDSLYENQRSDKLQKEMEIKEGKINSIKQRGAETEMLNVIQSKSLLDQVGLGNTRIYKETKADFNCDLVEEKKERKRKKSPMRNVNLSMKKIQFINKRRSNSVENSENYFTVENYKRQNYLVLAASVLFFLTLGIFIAVLQNK